MKLILLQSLFIGLTLTSSLNRVEVYTALSSSSMTAINSTINQLEKEKSSTKNTAYKGALITKKADLLEDLKSKLIHVKKGISLLESAIKSQPDNVEFRFLRLTVQENCPKIVKYNTNIIEDKKMILNKFSTLDQELKNIIKDYAAISKVITPSELR